MFVSTNLVTVSHASLEDEVSVYCESLRAWSVILFWVICSLKGVQEGLNHVVAIGVCREIKDILRTLGANS